MNPEMRDDYLLHYALDVEAKGSILSTENFKKPFDYKLSIATGNAGESKPERIDLVETFNYLIGLRVKHIDWQIERGYLLVEGTTPANERALIIWRDCEKVAYEDLEKLCATLKINPKDMEYDVIYVNGDHTIVNSITTLAGEGEATLTFKVRLIEDEFLSRMWDTPAGSPPLMQIPSFCLMLN
jgi:adenine-specific DNA-methyltransferase